MSTAMQGQAWTGWKMSDADAGNPDVSAYLHVYTAPAVRRLLDDLGFSYVSGTDANIAEERKPAWLVRERDAFNAWRRHHPAAPDWHDHQRQVFACLRLFGHVGYCREAVFIVPFDEASLPREARQQECEFFIRSVARSARMAAKCVLRLLVFEHSCVGEGEAEALRGAGFTVQGAKPMCCGMWTARPKVRRLR